MNEKSFIDRLVQLRVSKGSSAREMSLDLGMSENYINMVENGKISPSQNVFFAICDYFQISPRDFYDDDIANPILMKELLTQASRLDESSVRHVIEIMKSMNK